MNNLNIPDLFEKHENDDDSQDTMIPIESLVDFHDHIFPPYEEKAMLQLMSSIEANGLYESLLVRKHKTVEGKYEILSGHNRAEACRRLGKESVPSRMSPDNLSDDEAKLIVIETNLTHRSLNELAITYRIKIVAEWYRLLQKEKKRIKMLDEINVADLKTKDDGTEPFSLGSAQISRYVRLNDYLVENLKTRLNEGKLNILAAVELSFIEAEEQELVDNAIINGVKISNGKATAIKKKSKEVKITKEILEEILAKKKKGDEEKKKSFKLSDELIDKFFKDFSEDEIKETLDLALESYFKY